MNEKEMLKEDSRSLDGSFHLKMLDPWVRINLFIFQEQAHLRWAKDIPL